MKLKLTRAQRAGFFGSDRWPVLAGKGKAPVSVGYVHKLSTRLSFEVVRVQHPKPGEWKLEYHVTDDREQRFYLLPTARTLQTDEAGKFVPMPPEEEIGYTRNPRRVRGDWLRTVPPNLHNVMTMKSRLQSAEYNQRERATELAKQDARTLTAMIKGAVTDAVKMGADPQPMLRDLYKTLEAHQEPDSRAA